jgi:hypothetical protein
MNSAYIETVRLSSRVGIPSHRLFKVEKPEDRSVEPKLRRSPFAELIKLRRS